MSARRLDGRKWATVLKEEVREKVRARVQEGWRAPGLAVIQVGEDPASSVYVRNKRKSCEEVGIRSFHYALPQESSLTSLLHLIDELNGMDEVDGILCQLPLPKALDETAVLARITPEKDVDGFHPVNMGHLLIGDGEGIQPCTPKGVMELLRREEIPLQGKRALVIGRSNIVGKPMTQLLLQADATVTEAHSRSQDLPALCREADLLVVAVGKPRFVEASWVKPGAVVIDVGIHRKAGGGLEGDVDPAVAEVAAAMTPVPGGVGPLTIAGLLQNTYLAYLKRQA